MAIVMNISKSVITVHDTYIVMFMTSLLYVTYVDNVK